jgi:mannose/fructose/N-acetylgalactosamine-specific phosphotransferase system component IIC
MDNNNNRKFDFWTIFFGILSLILFNLALVAPEQKTLIAGFSIISVIFAIILFYMDKVNNNEKQISELKKQVNEIDNKFTESFNYLRDLTDLKADVNMLKQNKKGEITLLDIIKIIVAVILLYVIFEVIRSFQ